MSTIQRGFTLIELLLSIALIALLAGISVPVYQSLQTNRTADTEYNKTTLLTRRAQILARSGWHDDDWGIMIETSRAVLFKGDDFAGRDTDFDEEVPFVNMTADSPAEVFFDSISGAPSTTVSVVFTTTNNYQLNFSINEEGVINN